MGDGPTTGLFANLLTQPYRRASVPATGTIRLGEGTSTAKTVESPFIEHQHDSVPTQGHITLAAQAPIVLLGTHALAMRAASSLIDPDDLDFNAAIGLHLLTEDAQAWQV